MNKFNMMFRFNDRFIGTPVCLIPDKEYDFSKWAVVACDQHSEDEKYWEKVKEYVGDEPSTLNMIYPEVYLKKDSEEVKAEKIKAICDASKKYFETIYYEETTKSSDGFMYIRRNTSTGVRKGVVMCIDLKHVGIGEDFALSEEIDAEKMKIRKEIRKNSTIEVSHIIMFADDKEGILFGRDAEFAEAADKLFDFDLMDGGGHIEGYDLNGEKVYSVADSFKQLLEKGEGPTLVVADGNHALTAAKALYDDLEKDFGEKILKDHPLRYAMVEVVNIHDDAIQLFPIHRVIENCDKAALENIASKAGGALKENQSGLINIKSDFFNGCLDIDGDYLKQLADALKDMQVEYVHSKEEAERLAGGSKVTLIMPEIKKDMIFDYIKKNGVLPKKSFSIGEEKDKKYYVESRRIVML